MSMEEKECYRMEVRMSRCLTNGKFSSYLGFVPWSRGRKIVNPLLPKNPSVILPRLNTIGMVIYFWLFFIYQGVEYWENDKLIKKWTKIFDIFWPRDRSIFNP